MKRTVSVDVEAACVLAALYLLVRIMWNTDRIANQTGEIRREVAPREWEQTGDDGASE